MTSEEKKIPYRKVHFIGVGGVGMSGLALILLERGVEVSGSDEAVSDYTTRLQARGADLHFRHAAENVPTEADLIVYSSAVPLDNPEMETARQQGIRTVQRGIFLAELADYFPCVIAVAGSHGKTSTTAMIAHVLRRLGVKPAFLVGGDVPEWPANASAGAGQVLVTEVDESDGTQAYMNATYGVVVSVEDDHCWNVGGESELKSCFETFAMNAEFLLAWKSEEAENLFQNHGNLTFYSEADIPSDMKVGVPGDYNRINATLALGVIERLKLDRTAIMNALQSFPGVKRRFTKWLETPDKSTVIIEDYAHHPTELKAVMATLRREYPEHFLKIIFQPHRFERVRRYGEAFSTVLEDADHVTVVRPFAAWKQNPGDVAPENIAHGIKEIPADYWDAPIPQLASSLCEDHSATKSSGKTLFAVIGAGDVADVIPGLRDLLIESYLDKYLSALKKDYPDIETRRDKSWAQLTSLGIGSYKPLRIAPANDSELACVLKKACETGITPFILGCGTNLVGAEHAELRVVVELSNKNYSSRKETNSGLMVGAAVGLWELMKALIMKDKLPAEAAPLSWIPGSIGGAVRMNAGADGARIGDYVRAVHGIRANGERWSCKGDDIEWEYRSTDIPQDVCVTAVEMAFFRTGDLKGKDAASAVREKTRLRRLEKQPGGKTAGSVFKNAGTTAGALLDKCGCKGMRIGGCLISSKHANFIVAEEGATEYDLTTLARAAQWRVYEKTGVLLKPEVVFAGTEAYKSMRNNIDPLHVCVLMGGPSAEHDISLSSGKAVAYALREAGHCVEELVLENADLPELPIDTDIVFPALHGTFGEDGGVQKLLEERGVPYVGSRTEASKTMMDKVLSKQCLVQAGLPTPKYWSFDSADVEMPQDMIFPVVVKPASQGSTVGITKLNKPSGWWRRALVKALKVDNKVVAEEFVKGIEITVSVVHGRTLPVMEIIPPSGRMFDFDAKYDHKRGHTQYLCPPVHIGTDVQRRAEEIAAQAYNVLGSRDMFRLDMIVDKGGTPWILEANSIPGFTATSLLPKAAAAVGVSYQELCAALVAGKEL